MKTLMELVAPELGALGPYVPHAGRFAVRLDANEAPPLFSPETRALLGEEAARCAWERYPDATASELRRAIATHDGVTPEEVVVGVGSDELIALLLTVLRVPRGAAPSARLLTTTPTFVMYRLSARVRGVAVMEVPLDSAWDLAEESLTRAVEMSPPNLVFIASPNNPTGTMATLERLERLIQVAEGALVVLDEAYIDYAASPNAQRALYRKYDNVAILRTLSKVGFAALRVGWLIAAPALCRELEKARLPYNLATVSQRLATVALTRLAEERARLAASVIGERERVTAALGGLAGVTATPSQANFLWVRTELPAGEVFQGLAERGILVRSFHERGGRLAHQLRVTIGTPSENDAFLAALAEVT
ncbi:MAG: histidinol-phosphate transaminase [Sorangiineae bacterium]|nr:histidinol-phosphate transaminase [Polyangiaceae bacterium]MEB2324994.1 histidinol-phosphate transaminase [Sorangiineae bacterium]